MAQYGTTEVAQACAISLNTVRQWCRDYSSFLSSGARGEQGDRVFTAHDLEVLKYVAQLRSERMQKDAILRRLGETTFPEIEEQPEAPAPISPQDAPEAPGMHEITRMDNSTIYAIEARLIALERRGEFATRLVENGIVMFAIGFIAALLLVLLFVGLAALYLRP